MKNLPISPTYARVKPWSGLALGLTLGCAPLVSAPNATAQNAIVAPAPASSASATAAPSDATAPLPDAPNISVLIVALDDLNVPASALPVVPTVPALPVAPIAPADGAPAMVTPTGFGEPLRGQWRVLAQKKTKAEKKAEREAEEAKRFNVNPVAPTPYSKPGAPVPAPDVIVLGATGLPVAVPPIVRAPADPLSAMAPGAAASALPVFGAPGRSQMMAVPLRRALLAQGYKDVQVVTPESNTMLRALGEGRLTTRVIDELKRSLATLAANAAAGAAPDVGATITAGRAASRIGQATGYRAVVGFYVSEPTEINVVGAGATPNATTQKIAVNMVAADAQLERIEPLPFVETGDSEEIWRETGAAAGARLLDGTLGNWPATSSDNRAALALVHYNAARDAFGRGDIARAQDEMNQSLSLDSSRPDIYLLRGDILNALEPGSGYVAYQKAVELNSTSGQDWARISAAYAYAKTPDFRAAWDAGKRALALNYDSAQLRVAIATAQYGRAELFRKADYPGKAEEAEMDARTNLERALQLSPDDPTAVRLLARNLIEKRRFEEGARTLDRIAPRYPTDLEIQSQYATALGNQIGREEDAFAAYARVWKLSRQKNVAVDALTYRTLAEGFDKRLFNLGKVAAQLARGVASRAILRETALIQLSKLKEEMDDAQDAIAIMQPSGIGATAVQSRVFAANLMDQSLESFQTYLETGQADYFTQGDGLYRSAVASLNTARSTQ